MSSCGGSSSNRDTNVRAFFAQTARQRADEGLKSYLSRSIARFRERSEFVKVVIIAVIGTVLSWATYEIVFWVNPFEPRATVSWGMSFTIGIFRQHHLHRTLTFPRNELSYGATLRRDFVASLGIALLSTSFNYLLTEVFELYHRGAWVACALLVAGIEYLLMKTFIFPQRRRPACEVTPTCQNAAKTGRAATPPDDGG